MDRVLGVLHTVVDREAHADRDLVVDQDLLALQGERALSQVDEAQLAVDAFEEDAAELVPARLQRPDALRAKRDSVARRPDSKAIRVAE